MGSFKTENFTFIDFTDMDESMSRKVWECRNLPKIREWMVNPELIPYERHICFVNGLKDKVNTKYFAVLYDGVFIGSVNLHIEDERVAERGIYIHPNHWGKGMAKMICREFYSYVLNNWGVSTITTKVLKNNVGSNSLEHALGAVKISENDSLIYYNCDLKDY